MKNLDLIEDEYKISFEEVVEKYREKLKISSDHEKCRREFNKNFKKILDKRNKDFSNYIKKNKDKLLEMPEKKKKKAEKEMGVYKAYNLNFNKTLKDRIRMFWKKFSFRFILFYRSVKYNIIPSWLKLLFFKIGLFFKSLFFDIGNIRRFIGHRIGFFFDKYIGRIKERVMVVVNWAKSLLAKFAMWNKKRLEEAKKKKEEAEEKKKAAEEAKKKLEEDKSVEGDEKSTESKIESETTGEVEKVKGNKEGESEAKGE